MESDRSDHCTICLGDFEDRCVLSRCLHAFCFDCIAHWAKYKNSCPLCKSQLDLGFHDITEDDLYRTYQFTPPVQQPSHDPRFDTRATSPQRAQRIRRRRLRTPSPVLEMEQSQQTALDLRRRVYAENKWARHVGSNRYTGYNPLTPTNMTPANLERLRTWMRRELLVLTPQGADVEFLVGLMTGLVKRYAIQTEPMIQALRPFLSSQTEHFLHEMACFGRSRLSMADYDRLALYDWSEPVTNQTSE